MNNAIDKEKLKKGLMDYYGTAMFNSSPLAVMELGKIERANDEELLKIALKNGINLDKYKR